MDIYTMLRLARPRPEWERIGDLSLTLTKASPWFLKMNGAVRLTAEIIDEHRPEDHLDDGNLAEATYFLERMISETRKLKLTIEAAAVSQEPNEKLRRCEQEPSGAKNL